MTLHLAHRYENNTEENLLPSNVTFGRESAISKTSGSFEDAPRMVEVLTQRKTPRSAKVRAQTRSTTAAAPRLSAHEISRFACNVLEITHAFREFNSMHKDPELLMGFLSNKHIDDPRYTKMQRAFNSLKDRVTIHEKQDPRIASLFSQIVQKITSNPDSEAIPPEMERTIFQMVGMENIVSAGPFKKFGVICVKDTALPCPRPENVVTETELKEMNRLREKLRESPLSNNIKINEDPAFTSKTIESFEKILCYPEGRELVQQLYTIEKIITIQPDQDPCCYMETLEIFLSHQHDWKVGVSNGKTFSYLSPSWTVLAHEHIHAIHFAGGSKEAEAADTIPRDKLWTDLWTDSEEYVTIGDTEAIPRLSENGFARHTLHPQRIYHINGIGPKPQNSSLFLHISDIDDSGIDGDLERLLVENPDMRVRHLNGIATTATVARTPYLKSAILNHPRKEEFLTKDILLKFLISSIEENPNTVINEILENHFSFINELEKDEINLLFSKLSKKENLIRSILHSEKIKIPTLSKLAQTDAVINSLLLKSILLEHPERAEFINYKTQFEDLADSIRNSNAEKFNTIFSIVPEILTKISSEERKSLLYIPNPEFYDQLTQKEGFVVIKKETYLKDLGSAIKKMDLMMIGNLLKYKEKLEIPPLEFQPILEMVANSPINNRLFDLFVDYEDFFFG